MVQICHLVRVVLLELAEMVVEAHPGIILGVTSVEELIRVEMYQPITARTRC